MARAGGLALPTITEDRALGDAKIQRSLRFDDGDSAYLSRTPSSAGDRRTFTISIWVKRGNTGSGAMFGSWISDSDRSTFRFSSDYIEFQNSGTSASVKTDAVFRDTSGWYHVVAAIDTTQGTQSNRGKIYVNGVQQSLSSNNITQDMETSVNNNSVQVFGTRWISGANSNFDGYLAEINLIDGQQLDASYFGFTDPQTGIWMPKRYEGTYGTNGVRLDFSDNSGTAALGIDKSPNGNDFASTNLVIGDSTLDSPSNNFCVLRPYAKPVAGASFEEGNLKFSTGSTGDGGNLNRACMNTMIPSSGKWYMEVHASSGNYAFIGVHPFQTELTQGQQQSRWMGLYNYDGNKYVAKASSSASSSTYASSYGADIIGIFIDMDASTPVVYFSKNGQWANGSGSWNQSNPYTSGGAIELGDSFFSEGNGGHRGVGVLIRSAFSNAGITANVNFGQDSTFAGRTTAGGNKDGHGIGDFKYPVPTNALALCAKNLPLTIEPSVLKPKKHFSPLLYTGTGSSNIVEGLEFSPDMIWVKGRETNGYEHMIIDSVRGGTKSLVTSSTDAESTHGGRSMTFYPSGVRWNSDSGNCNANGEDYVLWCWKAGGNSNTFNVDGRGYTTAAAAGITDGDIAITGASVNTEAGFSVVTYTGSTTSGTLTVGHGLGKKPEWVIIKRRDATSDWIIGHKGLETSSGAYANNKFLKFDTSAMFTNSLVWGVEPTTTVTQIVTDGNAGAANLTSSGTYVMYSWAEVPGFSKFGMHKGSGDAEGKHVYCGFRPAWVMIKKISSSGTSWAIQDTTRDTINPTAYNTLAANSDSGEPQSGAGTFEGNFIDFVSDGFVLKSNAGTTNAENQSHIYMAFAEQPGTTAFTTYPNAR